MLIIKFHFFVCKCAALCVIGIKYSLIARDCPEALTCDLT